MTRRAADVRSTRGESACVRPYGVMRIQPITYRSRTVAVAVAGRFLLCGELERRPPGEPELTFVVFMCAYALDIAHGLLAGPYRDEDARAYARACLIPAELIERPALDLARAAAALHVPLVELRAARAEHATQRAMETESLCRQDARQRPSRTHQDVSARPAHVRLGP